MTAKGRPVPKGPVERLREKIATGDRGWFFGQIADRVAERRGAMGLSQRQLAELVGATRLVVARLDLDCRPPRIDTLLRIADALECDLVVELVPRDS
jgi:predicted transcriptional regulator